MLDLNTIFGMREQMMPQNGFLGFLLNHWLVIAIVVMVLGFLVDQVLYIVRYRPQDKWLRRWRNLLGFVQGRRAPEPEAEVEIPIIPAEIPSADQDAPVIRRGGAQYAPRVHKPEMEPPAPPERDEDAPVIVRAAGQKRGNEPDTRQ